jgi:hypothetical protein
MVRVTAAFWKQNAAVTRTAVPLERNITLEQRTLRYIVRLFFFSDRHLATVKIFAFEFRNTREYVMLLLLPLKLKGLSGKQLTSNKVWR